MRDTWTAVLIVAAAALTPGCAKPAPRVAVGELGAGVEQGSPRVSRTGEEWIEVKGKVLDADTFNTFGATEQTKVRNEAKPPQDLLVRQREAPYVILEDASAATRLYCFFPEDKAAEASTLLEGQMVTLRAILTSVERTPTGVVAVAWYCYKQK